MVVDVSYYGCLTREGKERNNVGSHYIDFPGQGMRKERGSKHRRIHTQRKLLEFEAYTNRLSSNCFYLNNLTRGKMSSLSAFVLIGGLASAEKKDKL